MKDTGVITSTQILSSEVKSYNIDIDITPMESKYNSAQHPNLSRFTKKVDIGALSYAMVSGDQYLQKIKQKQTNYQNFIVMKYF